MVKRCLLTGLVAGFLSTSSTLYAGESEIILKDNTTASGLTVKEETANTTIARFRGDGNVGIGTASPLAPLHVSGISTPDAGGPGFVGLIVDSPTGNNYSQEMFRVAGTYRALIQANSSGFLSFYTKGSGSQVRAVDIDSSGNVGIGTTAPVYKLDVNGDMNLAAGSVYRIGGVAQSASSKWTAGTGDNIYRSAGNVGIGTTGPTALLNIKGSYPQLAIDNSAANINSNILFRSNGADLVSIGPNQLVGDDNNYEIYSRKAGATGSRLFINLTSGNVGIGTTAPSEKLEVSGNIKASGTVSQGSSRELKKNISYISTKEAMKALNGLKPVRFEYKADNFGEEHLGFIAEDVPELVAEQDRKHLNPMDLTAVFAKVIQEQQKMLQDQKETIDAMKREMEMMKSAMNYGAKGL